MKSITITLGIWAIISSIFLTLSTQISENQDNEIHRLETEALARDKWVAEKLGIPAKILRFEGKNYQVIMDIRAITSGSEDQSFSL